ncbi:hypothetical protein D9M68_811090 [compost metagenome]
MVGAFETLAQAADNARDIKLFVRLFAEPGGQRQRGQNCHFLAVAINGNDCCGDQRQQQEAAKTGQPERAATQNGQQTSANCEGNDPRAGSDQH